jgi:hypothetical protein
MFTYTVGKHDVLTGLEVGDSILRRRTLLESHPVTMGKTIIMCIVKVTDLHS